MTLLIPIVTFSGAYFLLMQLGFANDPRRDYCPVSWIQIYAYAENFQDRERLVAEAYTYRSGVIQKPEHPTRLFIEIGCNLRPMRTALIDESLVETELEINP